MTTTVYAPIEKFYRDENGDFYVEGKATGPDLDLDGQICDPTWLGKAMPDWFEFANIREQHTAVAAGVGHELVQDGDSWHVKSLVVDPTSINKVEKKVLKGYSIGIANPRVIKDAAAPGGRIVDGQIVEISLVDRPCNPTAMLALAKAAKPGTTMKAFAFDSDRMLVKVEEFAEKAPKPADDDTATADDTEDETDDNSSDDDTASKAAELVTVVKGLVPDLAKGSPEQDIASAQEAIAAIAQLIISEAQGLAAGDLSEAFDIDELLCAVSALRWFIYAEQAEEDDEELTEITIPLAADADSTKNAAPTTSGADLAELVKKAVAEAVKPHEERQKALEAELAKVSALPRPGGPVLTRTAGDTEKAAARDELQAEITKYRRLAGEVNDPLTRDGYLKLAAAAELKLN